MIIVALGGAAGSIFRYLLSTWTQTLSKSIDFPYGTLAVNLLGCFVIGFLSQLAEERGALSSESRTFVFIGILGGFTTFSSFGNETINLFRDGETLMLWQMSARMLYSVSYWSGWDEMSHIGSGDNHAIITV